MAPGKVERREYEYVRHGTRSFILSHDVVTGGLLAPACGPTRTEADFLAHVQAMVASNPETIRWHIVSGLPNCQGLKRTWGLKARAASWPRW
ncbi:MAG: hypothetical protein ACXWOL_07720 [Ktedonobacteraceae bacterium]